MSARQKYQSKARSACPGTTTIKSYCCIAYGVITRRPACSNLSALGSPASRGRRPCHRSKKHSSRQRAVEVLLRNAYTDKKTDRRPSAFALRVRHRIAGTESLNEVGQSFLLSLCVEDGVGLSCEDIRIEIALFAE